MPIAATSTRADRSGPAPKENPAPARSAPKTYRTRSVRAHLSQFFEGKAFNPPLPLCGGCS